MKGVYRRAMTVARRFEPKTVNRRQLRGWNKERREVGISKAVEEVRMEDIMWQ